MTGTIASLRASLLIRINQDTSTRAPLRRFSAISSPEASPIFRADIQAVEPRAPLQTAASSLTLVTMQASTTSLTNGRATTRWNPWTSCTIKIIIANRCSYAKISYHNHSRDREITKGSWTKSSLKIKEIRIINQTWSEMQIIKYKFEAHDKNKT